MHEELDVPLRSPHRRHHPPNDDRSASQERALDRLEHRAPHRGVSYDAPAPIGLDLSRLELRLHEEHEVGALVADADERVEHGADRDEREVGDDQVEQAVLGSGHRADVHPLVHLDSGIVTHRGMHLPVADVDRDDLRCAVLEKALREAARRRAGIERAPTVHVDGEGLEGFDELVSPTAHEARRRTEDLDGLTCADHATRFVGRRAPDRDEPRVDGPLRGLTARGEPAAHELRVEPPARGHDFLAAAFFAGAFLAVDFFAADFLAAFFAGAFFAPADDLHRVDLALETGEILLRREPERSHLGHDLFADRLDDALGVLTAALDQLLHLLLGLLGLELARSHQVADDLLGLGPGGLCEGHAGFEVLPDRIELCHGPTRYRPPASVGSLAVIPLRDNLPTRRRPVATILLIAINVAVFLLVQSPLRGTDVVRIQTGTVRIDSELRFDLEYAAIPCELTQGRPLTINEIGKTFVQGDTSACDHNDNSPPLFPGKNVYLAVITSMFLHGGWLHLGFNMLFLWVFGNNVEDRLGWALYLLFYVLAGIFATAGQVLLNPSSTVPVIGASGAIAGVMGAYLGVVPACEGLHAVLRDPRVVP